MELIIGIVHLIHLEQRLQASLVKGRVVSHQWQSLNLWQNLSPYLWKCPGVHGILHGKSMHPSIPIGIILRLWLDETVVAIHKISPFLTITMPTEQTLVRYWLAVSKSIAAKFFMSAKLLIIDVVTSSRYNHLVTIEILCLDGMFDGFFIHLAI